MRFLDGGGEFVVGELRVARHRTARQHAAGGDRLDAVRAGFELFAHGFARIPGPVDLAPEEVPVTAGHTQHVAGGTDARTGDPSGVDRIAHVLRDRVRGADVAYRSHARFQRLASVLDRAQQTLVLRRGGAERHRIRLAAHLQMGVRVHQPRRHARRLEVARPRRGTDGRNLLALDDQVDIALRRIQRSIVEDPGANDHDVLDASSAWNVLLVSPCPNLPAMKREAVRTLSISTPVSMPRPFNR